MKVSRCDDCGGEGPCLRVIEDGQKAMWCLECTNKRLRDKRGMIAISKRAADAIAYD